MSPRKWAPSTLATITSFIVERDGPNCAICHAEPTEPLEIDHLDPDGPNHAKNLRLLCKTCNLARRRKRGRRGILSESTDESAHQLSLDDLRAPTDQAKREIPYADGSPEMKASAWFEPTYRAWIVGNLPMPKTDAINGGAEAVGCSPETATRYLAKLTSIAGPLTQEQNAHGILTIRNRKE